MEFTYEEVMEFLIETLGPNYNNMTPEEAISILEKALEEERRKPVLIKNDGEIH